MYIGNQEEHHRKRTFKDEFVDLLRKHEIEYDERISGNSYVARKRGLGFGGFTLPTACAVGYWYIVGFPDWSPPSRSGYCPALLALCP